MNYGDIFQVYGGFSSETLATENILCELEALLVSIFDIRRVEDISIYLREYDMLEVILSLFPFA